MSRRAQLVAILVVVFSIGVAACGSIDPIATAPTGYPFDAINPRTSESGMECDLRPSRCIILAEGIA